MIDTLSTEELQATTSSSEKSEIATKILNLLNTIRSDQDYQRYKNLIIFLIENEGAPENIEGEIKKFIAELVPHIDLDNINSEEEATDLLYSLITVPKLAEWARVFIAVE